MVACGSLAVKFALRVPAFGAMIVLVSCGGFAVYLTWIGAFVNENGALFRSKAGDKSTSLGIMPRLSRLSIPSSISFSVMGGGSAKGSSRKFLGKIRFGLQTLSYYRIPIPNFSSSMLLIPPYARPYLKWFGFGRPNFSLIMSCPFTFSGSLVKNAYFCSAITLRIGLLNSSSFSLTESPGIYGK